MGRWIGVERSVAGWQAVLYAHDGPIMTGIGKYRTRVEAGREALDWSISERVPLLLNIAAQVEP